LANLNGPKLKRAISPPQQCQKNLTLFSTTLIGEKEIVKWWKGVEPMGRILEVLSILGDNLDMGLNPSYAL